MVGQKAEVTAQTAILKLIESLATQTRRGRAMTNTAKTWDVLLAAVRPPIRIVVHRAPHSPEILQRHEVQMSPLRSRPGSHAD